MNQELGWEHKINPYKIEWLKKHSPKYDIHEKGKFKALDLGAGQGWYSFYLMERGFEVSAIDKNPGFHHPNIRIINKSLEEKLPFQDNEFDLVLAWDIIEHVKNEDQLLNEIKRILKNDGRIILSVPHADDDLIANSYLTYSHFKDKTHYREYIPNEIKENFLKMGFNVLQLDLVGGNPYPFTLLSFIENPFVRFITRIYIKILKKLKFIKNKNCHGDIFAAFIK